MLAYSSDFSKIKVGDFVGLLDGWESNSYFPNLIKLINEEDGYIITDEVFNAGNYITDRNKLLFHWVILNEEQIENHYNKLINNESLSLKYVKYIRNYKLIHLNK